MADETASKTLLAAGLVSIICSVIVSGAAVFLQPYQEKNKELDRKRNILKAAGLFEEGKPVAELFRQFEPRIIRLETGETVEDMDPDDFSQSEMAQNEKYSVDIPPEKDLAGIKRRSKFARVYLARGGNGRLRSIVLPVHGKGLWSTMYGFLVLKADATTIQGFSFYEHGETPGLGGEVDNPRWKALWPGKKAYDANRNPSIRVIKGKTDPQHPESKYRVDGLSGATITSRGVTRLLHYWLGEDGFKPFLERTRAKERN